jgi:hypothetical protein
VVNLLSPGQGILANQTLPNIGQGRVLDIFDAADGDELFHLACLGHTIKQVDIEHGLAVRFVCLTHWLIWETFAAQMTTGISHLPPIP